MTTVAEKYSALLNRNAEQLKRGSLRFWGIWFGRPYDNYHSLMGTEAQSDVLRIRFHGGELLSVWSPMGLDASASIFQIADAERVRWEWYDYGKPQALENLCFVEYLKGQRGISPDCPAVEML